MSPPGICSVVMESPRRLLVSVSASLCYPTARRTASAMAWCAYTPATLRLGAVPASVSVPPTIKQITDCLERGVEPCGHLRERGQGASLLFHQRRQQGDAFFMALDHVTVAAQRRIVQKLRPFQDRETVLMVGGVHAEVLLVYRRVLTGRWRCAGDSAGTVIRIGTLQFSVSAALLTIPPLLPRMFLGRAVTYSISCLLVLRDMLIQIKQALP